MQKGIQIDEILIHGWPSTGSIWNIFFLTWLESGSIKILGVYPDEQLPAALQT